MDYVVPFLKEQFLVVINSNSNWLGVHEVSTALSATTIQKLRIIYAIHGLPDMLVCDKIGVH